MRVIDSKYTSGIPKVNVYLEEYIYYVPAIIWSSIFSALAMYQNYVLVDGLDRNRYKVIWLMVKCILVFASVAYIMVTIDSYCKDIRFYAAVIEILVLAIVYCFFVLTDRYEIMTYICLRVVASPCVVYNI